MFFKKESEIRSQLYLFLLLIAISLLAFLPSAKAGFTYDFLGWARQYQNGTFLDAINSFGYKGLHPVLHLTSMTLTKLFGVESVLWYVFMSIFHGLNAFVLFKFLRLFFNQFNVQKTFQASAVVSILFIIHPYNIEPVVWRACMHYLIAFFCVISSLYFITSYFDSRNFKHYLLALLFYTTALFSLEISYITSLLWLSLSLPLNFLSAKTRPFSLWKILLLFFLVPISFLGFYLFLTYIKIGHAIGHYGAEKHLEFDFFIIVNNALDYLLKHLFFARDFKLYYTPVYHIISSKLGLSAIVSVVLLSLTFILFKLKNIYLKLSAIALILFGIALLPIVNLFYVKLLFSENDRYGYLASPFIITFLVLLFWQFKSRLKWIPLLVYFTISAYCFGNLIFKWQESEKIYNGLVDSFDYFHKKEVILLNLPDNYNGIFMFKRGAPQLKTALEVLNKTTFTDSLISVAEYSMLRPNEKFAIRSDTVNHINVTFGQWGSWWMKNALGAVDYENERLKFSLDRGMSYNLEIKGALNADETIILYQEGKQWKTVDIRAVKSSEPVKINKNEGVY